MQKRDVAEGMQQKSATIQLSRSTSGMPCHFFIHWHHHSLLVILSSTTNWWNTKGH